MAELSCCKESWSDTESLKYLLYGPSKKKSVNPCLGEVLGCFQKLTPIWLSFAEYETKYWA